MKARTILLSTALLLGATPIHAQGTPGGAGADATTAGSSAAVRANPTVGNAAAPEISGTASGQTSGSHGITAGSDGTSGTESRPADPQDTTPGVSVGGETIPDAASTRTTLHRRQNGAGPSAAQR